MKKFILIFTSFIFLMVAGCKKNNSDTTFINTSTEVTPVTTALVAGPWKVTYFFIDGTNRTNDFADFKFTFNSGGLLTGANSLFSENGSWSLTSASTKTKLNINLSSSTYFQDFTNDWEINSRTSTTIIMQHVSGSGSTQIDYLTIQKV